MANRRPPRDAPIEQPDQYYARSSHRGPYQEPQYRPSTTSTMLHGGDPRPPSPGAFAAPYHPYDYAVPPSAHYTQGHFPAHVQPAYQPAYPQGPHGQFTGTHAIRGYQSSYAPHHYPNQHGYAPTAQVPQPPPPMRGMPASYEYHTPPPAQYSSGAPSHHGSMYHEEPYEPYHRGRSPDFGRQPPHHGQGLRRRSPSPEEYYSEGSEDSYHEESRDAYRPPVPAPSTSRAQRSGRTPAPSTRRLGPAPPAQTRETRQDQPHPRQTLPPARRPQGQTPSSRGGRASSSYQDVRQGDYTEPPRLPQVEAPKAIPKPSAQDTKPSSVKPVSQHGQPRRSPVTNTPKPVAKDLSSRNAANESFKRQQGQLSQPAKPNQTLQPTEKAQSLPRAQPLIHADGSTTRQCLIAESRGRYVTQEDLDYPGVCGNFGCFGNHSPNLCDLKDKCMGCDEFTHLQRNCTSQCRRCLQTGHSATHCKDFANGRPTDKYVEQQKLEVHRRRLHNPAILSLEGDDLLYPDEHRSGSPSTQSRAIDPPRSSHEPSRGGVPNTGTPRSSHEPSRGVVPNTSTRRSGQEPSRGVAPNTGTPRSSHEPSRGVVPKTGTLPPHLRSAPVASGVHVGMHAQKPNAEPAKRFKTKELIRPTIDQHGRRTGFQVTSAETMKQIQQWQDPNSLIDSDRKESIRVYVSACAAAFRYSKNRVGSYTFRHPNTRKLTFDASNGDWESHVMGQLPDGISMHDTHVSPIFSDADRLDRNIDPSLADQIRRSFLPWKEAYNMWVHEESLGETATDSAAPMAKPSDDLIDLTEPAPLPYSEPSVSPSTDAPENLGLRGLTVDDSIHEPSDDDGPDAESQ